MYLRDLFEESRPEVLARLVAGYPLGAIATVSSGVVDIEHLPFLYHPSIAPCGTLCCHVGRGNPLWQSLPADREVLIVFQGPSTYISPSWSPGRSRHGKVAPSWNYAVVHAHGVPRVIHEHEWLRAHLEQLTASQEAHRPNAWALSEPPGDFIAQLLNHIVGIEFRLTRMVGKWFVSQQRSPADRAGVIEGLLRENTDAARSIAEMIESHAPQKAGERAPDCP